MRCFLQCCIAFLAFIQCERVFSETCSHCGLEYEIKLAQEQVKLGESIKIIHCIKNSGRHYAYIIRGDLCTSSWLFDVKLEDFLPTVGPPKPCIAPLSVDNIIRLKPGETYKYVEEMKFVKIEKQERSLICSPEFEFTKTMDTLWLENDWQKTYIPQSGVIIWGFFTMDEHFNHQFVPETLRRKLHSDINLLSNSLTMKLKGETLVVCEEEKYSVLELKKKMKFEGWSF